MPFLARLPGVSTKGWSWLTDYLPGVAGTLFFLAFALVPAIALWAFGVASKRAPLAYWFAAAALTGFLLWAHGGLNLRASSTAAVALLFIPIYAIGAVVAGWLVGWIAQKIAKDDRARMFLAGSAMLAAITGGVAVTMKETTKTGEREARFPVIDVKEIPLQKRAVPCCGAERVDLLALDEFDSHPGVDLVALGSQLAVIDPRSYAVRSTAPFKLQDCNGCVHMYPYAVADGKGGLLVATSDGLHDARGALLWETRAQGFSRTVPIRAKHGEPAFLSYHNSDRIELRRADGKIAWSVKIAVQDAVAFADAAGNQLPAAIVGERGARRLHVFDTGGKESSRVPLPDWASSVQAVAWPTPGNLLVGSGSWIGVVEPSGREVLRHVIQGTSFKPYHGPDGTAVSFRENEPAYLAVASHGSSGYARSVLLVFDPAHKLVWREELGKIRSMIAAPSPSGRGEVLLVGGVDGVIEYALP